MANSSGDSHEIVIYGAHFRVTAPLLNATGDLVTGATGLDSEVSVDGGTFADCTNEATELATASGVYYLDIVGSELTCKQCAVIIKTSTSGAKTTTITLYPRRLCKLASGTAQAGAASTITLAAATSKVDNDLAGVWVLISNNSPAGAQYQARKIISNVASTQVATVDSAWGTNPSSASTYDLLSEITANVSSFAGTLPPSIGTAGIEDTNAIKLGGTTQTGRDIGLSVLLAANQHVIVDSGTVTTVTNQLTGPQIATSIFQDTTAGDFTVAASIGKSIMNGVALGTGLTIVSVSGAVGSVTGAVGSVTGNVGGNVTGSVGSVVGAVGSVTGAVGSVTGNVGGNVTGSVGSVVGLTASNLDATVSSRLASASYTAPDNTTIGLIYGKIDTEVGTLQNTLDALVVTVGVAGLGLSAIPKTGYILAATGLDSITATAPTGVASTFPVMLVQLWRRFFKRTVKDATTIKTYGDNGTSVLTTQNYTSVGGTDDVGGAS